MRTAALVCLPGERSEIAPGPQRSWIQDQGLLLVRTYSHHLPSLATRPAWLWTSLGPGLSSPFACFSCPSIAPQNWSSVSPATLTSPPSSLHLQRLLPPACLRKPSLQFTLQKSNCTGRSETRARSLLTTLQKKTAGNMLSAYPQVND